jgi:hypothetical protein
MDPGPQGFSWEQCFMNFNAFKVLFMASVASLVLAGCGGAKSEEQIAALQVRYKEAGGFGLGRELAAKFPGAKTLVVLPRAEAPEMAYYTGFKKGAAGLDLVEISVTEISAPMPRGGVKKAGPVKDPAIAERKKGARSMTAEWMELLVSKKGAGCTVLVSFAGLPTKQSTMNNSVADPGTLNPWPSMSKTKVAVIGTMPVKMASVVKNGTIVAVVVPKPEIYKNPADAEDAKLFDKCWSLITPTGNLAELP